MPQERSHLLQCYPHFYNVLILRENLKKYIKMIKNYLYLWLMRIIWIIRFCFGIDIETVSYYSR